MRIEKVNLLGNPFIGVFASTNDTTTLLPSAVSKKFTDKVKQTLQTNIVKMNLCNSTLIGVFSVSNEHGIVVPETAYEDEIKLLEKHFENVGIIKEFTAIGNLSTANENGCIASKHLSKKSKNILSNTLGVKVKTMTLANTNMVGSSVLATNQGFLANPNINDKELKTLEKTFGVEGNVGSINYGTPFIKGGLIANKKGAIAGPPTTSYELGRIDEALFLGRKSND